MLLARVSHHPLPASVGNGALVVQCWEAAAFCGMVESSVQWRATPTLPRWKESMITGRIVIIPFLRGKLAPDGTLIEPDIDGILEKWLQRRPEHRGKDFHIIRTETLLLPEDVVVPLVRVTVDVCPELADYDPGEDADLYGEFLAESRGSPTPLFHKIWIEQCEAAEKIEAEHGTETAMGYLIGEKLLSFLEVAETKPEWRAEIPHFIAEIKDLFEPWQLAQFFETPRRLGTLGHIADEEGHRLLRSQLEPEDLVREDARNLSMFEWAKELLLEEKE
jgi:hypothetical protein